MAKPKRVQRPKDELKRELVEQLQLLRHSCQAFDGGLEAVAKHISLSLRVLLHHHVQSRALLDQLGLRNGRYLTSTPPLNPKNLLTECNLVLMHLGPTGARYLPLIAAGGSPFPMQPIPFVDWWNNPILFVADVIDTLLKGPEYYATYYSWDYPLRQGVFILGTSLAIFVKSETYQKALAYFMLLVQVVWIITLFNVWR